ncbi:MAG TPA: MFS transporter [Candidatus Dormibacteraeota bacterium]|nr:MFS transporter [Candidatus Dormibacteraeota bacterium]
MVLPAGPLRSRASRWVWFGEGFSLLGDASYDVVFAWLVLSVSRSPATLGAVLVLGAVPRGALLLVGGAMTDRLSPRAVMLASHLGRGALVAILAAGASAGALATWHLYLAAAVFGVADAFFLPAAGSILPTLVDKQDLARANALTGTAEQVARLAGPVLGGGLIAAAGTTAALAFNAGTFFVAATTLLAAPRGRLGTATPLSASAVLAEIKAGLGYAVHNVEMRIVLLVVAASTLSYSGLFRIGLPVLARHYAHGSLLLGIMISAWGLGQLAGALSASVTGLPRRWGALVCGMAVIEGASFAALALAPRFGVAVVLLVLLGFGVAYSSDVALPTFIQARTPGEMLGRATSVLNLPRVALEPVSLALT